MTDESHELLTPAEVARLFRVDPKTVTRWANEGKLAAIRTLGGHRRYRRADLTRYIDPPAPPEPAASEPATAQHDSAGDVGEADRDASRTADEILDECARAHGTSASTVRRVLLDAGVRLGSSEPGHRRTGGIRM